MGKITFYCTICAGPLYNWEQRKASMMQPGDNRYLYFDDACECGYEENETDGREEEKNSEVDLLKHDEYCNYRQGYWSDILSELDIAKPGCCACGRILKRVKVQSIPDDGSPCYLTSSGVYDLCDGFILPVSDDDSLWPNQDGFLVHDACWKMLLLVHETTRPTQALLSPSRVYQAMQSKLLEENDTYIYWDDARLYGGTEQFAEQEWVPVPGYEWLVANPMKETDLSGLVEKSTKLELKPRNGCPTSGTVLADPFARLPIEVHYTILELLPSSSILSLLLSSRAFCAASINPPPSFCKSRILKDTPWFEGTSLHETLSKETAKIDHENLLSVLKNASYSLPDGRNTRYEIYLSLKNRRRIWTCCEGILDIMEQQSKDSNITETI